MIVLPLNQLNYEEKSLNFFLKMTNMMDRQTMKFLMAYIC